MRSSLFVHTIAVFLLSCFSAKAQTYLKPDWLIQPDIPVSTGPVTITDAVQTETGDTYTIGYLLNAADFDPSPDTFYVSAAPNLSQFLAKYDKSGKLIFAEAMSGTGDRAYNSFRSIATDTAGNAYITGTFGLGFDFDPGPGVVTFSGGYYESDIFIAKYGADGHLVFAKPIVSNNNNSIATSIAIDKQNNICIGGIISGKENDFDPGAGKATLPGDPKGDGFFAEYDKDGNFIFAKQITGTEKEIVNAIAVDTKNNILVAGTYTNGKIDPDPGPDTAKLEYKNGGDLFFAKYTSEGDFVFAKSVGGSGYDIASSIITDSKNNIILTGQFGGLNADFDPGKGKVLRSVAGSNDYSDVFVEKFDSSGNYVWVNTGGGLLNDKGTGVAADRLGNVYITGTVEGTGIVFHNKTGTDTLQAAGGTDMFFAKYDTAGTCVYVNKIGNEFNETANNILLTGQNRLLVTGNYTGFLYFTPKNNIYAPNSTILFANYTTNGKYVAAKDIDVFGYFSNQNRVYKAIQDEEGNTYTVGQFQGVTDFDQGPGTMLLTSASSLGDNIFNNYGDQFFAKYDKNGKPLFVKTFTTTGYDPQISDLTTDDEQNIYICGSYIGQINYVPGTDTAIFGNQSDWRHSFFAKYDKNGKYLFSVNAEVDGGFTSLVLDKQKNIHLTGGFYGYALFNPADSNYITESYGDYDMLLAEYDPQGRFIYVKHVGQSGSVFLPYAVYTSDMKMSPSGRVIICGTFTGSRMDFDPGPGRHFLSTGHSTDTYFVAAYTSGGDFLFATSADTASTGTSGAHKLALDGEEVVLVGTYNGKVDLNPALDVSFVPNNAVRCPFLIRYNSAGAIQFIQSNLVSAQAQNTAYIGGVSVDASHHIYIAGHSTGLVDFDFGAGAAFLDSSNIFVAKYDRDGSINYVQGILTSSSYLSLYTMVNSLYVNQQNEILLAAGDYTDLDVDPGPGTLFFHPPVYRHEAFYVIKYEETNEGKLPCLLTVKNNAVIYRKN